MGDFLLLGRLLKPVVTTLSVVKDIIGLFLQKCHFSIESIFGLHFIDIGQLLTQTSWSP